MVLRNPFQNRVQKSGLYDWLMIWNGFVVLTSCVVTRIWEPFLPRDLIAKHTQGSDQILP